MSIFDTEYSVQYPRIFRFSVRMLDRNWGHPAYNHCCESLDFHIVDACATHGAAKALPTSLSPSQFCKWHLSSLVNLIQNSEIFHFRNAKTNHCFLPLTIDCIWVKSANSFMYLKLKLSVNKWFSEKKILVISNNVWLYFPQLLVTGTINFNRCHHQH